MTHERPEDDRSPASAERVKHTAQHLIHANADEPVDCTGCHELVAGQYMLAASWQCEKCHPNAKRTLHATTTEHSEAHQCFSCHEFTTKSENPTACLSCHAEPQGQLPAIMPHDPKKPDEDCKTCHRAHKEPSLESTACESCHDKETVTGHTAPGIQITGCASCHGYHETASVAAGRCTNCHRQSRALVSMEATFAGGHETCVTCHKQHRFEKSEVRDCRSVCHEKVVALSENKVKDHRACMSCHDKHDVRNSPRASCTTCHKKVAPKHPADDKSGSRCVGCHEPHRGPGAGVAVACTKCHDEARSDRGFHQGADGRGPACRNCHQPHGFKLASAGVGFCNGCHGRKPFKNAPSIATHAKHKDCFRCHGDKVAHQPAGPRAACVSCHKEKKAVTHKDHQKCVGCHDPHSTVQQNPCGSCHDEQAKVARSGHRKCVSCHEPHSTTPKKDCAGCHRAQERTAPAKHKDCRQCHDKHSTLVVKTCASCHKDRATGIHKAVPGGCRSCHRPHGPKGRSSPPACRSCHKDALPDLHQSSGHRDCERCHQSHGDQLYDKTETCLACHEDMKDHEPDAAMCIGCHAFRRAR